MLEKTNLLLAVPPAQVRGAARFHLPLAHVAYRVGGGPHLFRASIPVSIRGGYMVIDNAGFSGGGEPGPFCQEVLRECAARLQEAVQRFGRVVLAVERVAEDFYLPSPTGQGTPLTRDELAQRLEERAPQVYFSTDLCAHYFTYMSDASGAHFVLFDDAGSIRKKLQLARQLDIGEALLPYAQVDDLLPELLGG